MDFDDIPVINYFTNGNDNHLLHYHYDYPEKYEEIIRFVPKDAIGAEFIVDEIQSDDPLVVAKSKAINAWKYNNKYPILTEDTSFYILGLDGFPGTHVNFFIKNVDQRRLLCDMAIKKKDLRAKAVTILSYFDGHNFHFFKGETNGKLATEPNGSNGFGFDDIFIPAEQKIAERTFAEMSTNEKDKYSMRKKAWDKFFASEYMYSNPIYQLPEPYEEEIRRIRYDEINSRSFQFAKKLEPLNKSDNSEKNYIQVIKERGDFYEHFYHNINSYSLGLILTNIDKTRLEHHTDGNPIIWQMGPKRRSLALAQRALFFDENQNAKIHNIVSKFEKGKLTVPKRSNKRIHAVEEVLGFNKESQQPTRTPAVSELGYKKISSGKKLSRSEITKTGLFNLIGKYPRKIIGLGSMPPVTGWRDTLVTASLGHMLCFIPRNSLFAGDIQRRIKLAKSSLKVIYSLDIPTLWKKRAKRNIGASLGLDNPKKEVETASRFIKEAGIKLFRIYTIGSDKRSIETAYKLRQKFGSKIEIFFGQVADKKQALKLISPSIAVDGLIFGHGGGQQCTSAINGMAITTLEDVYNITLDPRFNNTSILVEGGIDNSIGTALLLGIDGTLGNQKLVHGTIETGDLFVQNKKGKIGQPYPGSASPVTQTIESEFDDIRHKRSDASGRTYHPEGKPGFMYFEKKANSMTFWINEFLGHAARTLADLGVKNIPELRQLLQKSDLEFLRYMTERTRYMSDAYGNYA